MSAKTKIVVLRMKELVYTGIFVILGILIVLVILFFAFSDEESSEKPLESEESSADAQYVPGIYHTQLTLNGMQVDLEVALDANHINAISLINLDESIITMYPLLSPTFEELKKQICEKQSMDSITYQTDSKYTSLMILQAIDSSLKKAQKSEGLSTSSLH